MKILIGTLGNIRTKWNFSKSLCGLWLDTPEIKLNPDVWNRKTSDTKPSSRRKPVLFLTRLMLSGN